MIVGHEGVLARLHRELPPVSLFIGPPSVGKWAVAEHIRAKLGITEGEVLRIHKLSASLSQEAVKFASTAPAGEAGKLAIIRIDGASPQVIHRLLKTLEAAPKHIWFIFIATREPLETLSSRAAVFQFKMLTNPQIAQVLAERRGFKTPEAQRFAELSGGRVDRALKASGGYEAKAVVLACLEAFRARNPAMLDALANKWDDEATELLASWCNENITKRWKIFSEDDELEGTKLPLKILMALNTNIRPRLIVRSSLMTILRG